eukprot:GHVP01019826.1.p2 GENE.GHVP01019826.1~~GHVP01019826.1.p2  ORF type:complete len:347 (-),score=75.62 GHVP01019826.1:486-1526(-)
MSWVYYIYIGVNKLAKALHRSAFDKDKVKRGGVLQRWEESRIQQKKIQKSRKPVDSHAGNGEEIEVQIEEIEQMKGITTEHMNQKESEVVLIESSSEGGISPEGSNHEGWESARSSDSSVLYINEMTPVDKSPSCIVLTDRSFTKSPLSAVENFSPPALPKSFAETFPAKLIRKSSDRRLSSSDRPSRSPHNQISASKHESQSDDGTPASRSDICLTPMREELLFDFHTGLTPARGETPQQETKAPKEDDECSVTDDLWSGIDKPKTYQQYMWVSKIAGKKKKVTKKMRKGNQRKSFGVTEEMNRVLSMNDKLKKKNVKREDKDQFCEAGCEDSDRSSSEEDSDEN